MAISIDLWLEDLNVFVDQIILLLETKDFAQAHVALIDQSKPLRFTRDINAGSAVLCIAVYVTVLISSRILKFKISPHVSSLFGLDHLFIASFLVV